LHQAGYFGLTQRRAYSIKARYAQARRYFIEQVAYVTDTNARQHVRNIGFRMWNKGHFRFLVVFTALRESCTKSRG
jgi:hypothetical protein